MNSRTNGPLHCVQRNKIMPILSFSEDNCSFWFLERRLSSMSTFRFPLTNFLPMGALFIYAIIKRRVILGRVMELGIISRCTRRYRCDIPFHVSIIPDGFLTLRELNRKTPFDFTNELFIATVCDYKFDFVVFDPRTIR